MNLKLLRSLGLSIRKDSRYRHAYLAIIDNRYPIVEKYGADNQSLTHTISLFPDLVNLCSYPYHYGNKANIVINSTDWSLNKLRLNIVLMDKLSHNIIDSAAFDTIDPSIPCTRHKNFSL